jgi:hypothetical protein
VCSYCYSRHSPFTRQGKCIRPLLTCKNPCSLLLLKNVQEFFLRQCAGGDVARGDRLQNRRESSVHELRLAL